ncbi:MAG: FAD:protein FMN transferase [Clostridia bacterium]|nr:FAD:protein FMN transferase [Clostridia bacterium]
MKKKGAILAAVAVVILAAVIVCDFLFNKTVSDTFLAMNTTVSAELTGLKSEDALTQVKEKILYLDEKLLSRTNENSEIYSVNSGKTEVSNELASLLNVMKQLEKNSGGAFCIGVAQLTDLWGIGTEYARVPDEAEIKAAIKNCYDWQIDGNTVYLPEGVKLDLGAVGKGEACDHANSTVSFKNCKESVVAVGGSVLLHSTVPKALFKVGIRDPLGEANEYCAVLEIGEACVSTSGNYERFFEDESGKRYHHIFDPSTGYPADSGLMSVTVVTQSGTISDALSTACFVLGIEKSLPLLERYNAEAVFITEDKQIITTYGELENETVTVTNDIYTLGEAK